MRLLGLLLVLACASYRGQPPALPTSVSDSVLQEAFREADLVVLGTPDTIAPEAMLAPSLQFGARDAWWNIRITVEQVYKGSMNRAKFMDYGDLPAYLTPPRPFPLAKNQILIQHGNRWRTAPVVLGERAVYFLRLCYRCVDLPNRNGLSYTASPWFAILAVPLEE